METLISFLVGVASSIAAVFLLQYRALYVFLPTRSRKGYLIELEEKIRQMPFIYKDLEIDIINDFVDIELQDINLGTLRLQATNKAIDIKEDEKLRRTRRMLFLGNAGIGKTTFQRRTILSLIRKKRDVIYSKERPVPLYIPLKAIDNSKPFPVYRYIRENNPLFSHRFGFEKLLKLTRKGKLFLFLDGYDEIPFTGDTDNFVQRELGLVLFPESAAGAASLEDDLKTFYKNLSGCRVWLSSRLEFFEKNPIGLLGSGNNLKLGGLAAVELKGIGNNRIQLVRKIFDKYRQRSSEYYQFLDEEFFLYEVDNSEDAEISSLSYNPLFLTVMCYIYAQKAIEEKNHKVLWANKFEDLILECLDLLINDLDEIKARDLSKAQRAGLQTRRNLYSEEKKLFLQYFALQLFFDNKSVFTLQYLKAKIIDFFKKEYVGFPSDTIIKNLSEDNPSKPNFALQLIYQGVFVLVDKSKSETSYDFPQRRFREVLGSRYIATPERYEQLLANIEKKQFTEFLAVFFNSTGFRNLVFQEQSLTYILQKAKGEVGTNYYLNVTRHFMKHKPDGYDVTTVVRRFLIECLAEGVGFRISKEVINQWKPDADLMTRLRTTFRDAVEAGDPGRLSLCCALLNAHNRVLLIELLSVAVRTESNNRPLLPVLFQYTLKTDPESVVALKEQLMEDREFFLDFCYALSHHLAASDRLSEQKLAPVLNLAQTTETNLFILFYFVQKYSPNFYRELQSFFDFAIAPEVFAHTEDAKATATPLEDRASERHDGYLITEQSLKHVNSFLKKRVLPIVFEVGVTNDRGRQKWMKGTIAPSKKFQDAVIDGFSSALNKLHDIVELAAVCHKILSDVIAKLTAGDHQPTDGPIFMEVRNARVSESTEDSLETLASEMTQILSEVCLINERYFVTPNVVRDIRAFLDRRKIAVVAQEVFQNSLGFPETLYAVVEPLPQFKSEIIDGLQRLKARLYLPVEFNSQIREMVSKALDNLKRNKFHFDSPQNLPAEVRAEEAREAERYRWEGFERDVVLHILRSCLVDGNKVHEVRRVVDGISYTAAPIIELVG